MSFFCLHCHVVFATKDRSPVIEPDMKDRLYSYIGGILKGHGCTLISAGGIPDHVHLLVSFTAKEAISDVIRDVKGCSSKWVHETFPGIAHFGWQDGYSVFAVSVSNIDAVKKYIERQSEHHKKVSFRDELLAFLKKHNLPYDEKYL